MLTTRSAFPTHTQEETAYRVCDATGEDFSCSNSYLWEYDVKDHTTYLGVPM